MAVQSIELATGDLEAVTPTPEDLMLASVSIEKGKVCPRASSSITSHHLEATWKLHTLLAVSSAQPLQLALVVVGNTSIIPLQNRHCASRPDHSSQQTSSCLVAQDSRFETTPDHRWLFAAAGSHRQGAGHSLVQIPLGNLPHHPRHLAKQQVSPTLQGCWS